MSRLLTILGLLLTGGWSMAHGQEPPKNRAEPENAEREKQFEEALHNVALVGHFTLLGEDAGQPKPERYEISNVRKLDEGDLWLFNARIQYGEKDQRFPLPLEVKWAGRTPVITVDKVTIPGMGTFSAYVVIDGNKYAGTWSHGDKGGHLYGQIEKLTEPAADEE